MDCQEQLFALNHVPRLNWMPSRASGKAHHAATVYRWAQRGIKGVRLETVQVGGTRCTSVEALHRFFHNSAQRMHCLPPPIPTVSRLTQIKRATKEVEALLGGAPSKAVASSSAPQLAGNLEGRKL